MPHPDSENDTADHVFFAKQIINNACATQAILSILMNNSDIELGDDLANFKSFTADFPPDVCHGCNQVGYRLPYRLNIELVHS
jgi:ubiquitin carboxyl-terminal hydrolase L5